LIAAHRIGGYLFIALFCAMGYFMLARLGDAALKSPSRQRQIGHPRGDRARTRQGGPRRNFVVRRPAGSEVGEHHTTGLGRKGLGFIVPDGRMSLPGVNGPAGYLSGVLCRNFGLRLVN